MPSGRELLKICEAAWGRRRLLNLIRNPCVLPLMDLVGPEASLDSGGDLSRVDRGASVGSGGRNRWFGSLTLPVG